MKDLRDVFFYRLLENAKKNPNIILLTADMGAFALEDFKRELPDQIINVGISEQIMVSIAAGLAMRGKTVYCYTISAFLLQRAFEQIKIDVCNHNLDVRLVGIGGGADYSYDGSTHHCPIDIALMRTIPNMRIVAPFDKETMLRSVEEKGPVYIRLIKGESTNIEKKLSGGYNYNIGEKKHIGIITYGSMVRNINMFVKKHELINNVFIHAVYSLKPFFLSEVIKYPIIIENHSEIGGLKSIYGEQIDLPHFAFRDEFYDIAGSIEYVHENYGIEENKILEKIKLKVNKNE